MKYIDEPNLTIIDYENNLKVFQFDSKGEYETTDNKIIEFMAKNKPWIKNIKNRAKKG